MDWRQLPLATLFADVRTYCPHVNMYCKRERLLSSHPRLFIHSLCLLHPTPAPPPPPQFRIVFIFSWVLQSVQEKLKMTVVQKVLGAAVL